MLFSDCSAIALDACAVQLLWMHNIDLLKIALSFSSFQVLQRNNMEKVAALVPKIIQVISSSIVVIWSDFLFIQSIAESTFSLLIQCFQSEYGMTHENLTTR